MADIDRVLDRKTIVLWGGAIFKALRGDNGALCNLLDSGVEVTDDVAQFVAWLLREKPKHRPPLPAKFQFFAHLLLNPKLNAACAEIEQRRTAWLAAHPGKRFQLQRELKKFGSDADAVRARLRLARRIGELWVIEDEPRTDQATPEPSERA
jgi:hypothetical protein